MEEHGTFFGGLKVSVLVSALSLFKTAPKQYNTRKVVLKIVRFLLTYSYSAHTLIKSAADLISVWNIFSPFWPT